MTHQCVLLDRRVRFINGPSKAAAAAIDGPSEAAAAAIDGPSEAAAAAIDRPRLLMEAMLEAMKPDPVVFDPPEISHLRMVRQVKGGGLAGGTISCTDKSYVVLYTGLYQPGFSSTPTSGCYLVYNASCNSLSAIPQLPDKHTFSGLGRGAAILSRGEGEYILVELVASKSGFPNAVLFQWQYPNPTQGQTQWIQKAVRLPQVFTPEYSFHIDTVFSYAPSSICWVDLLKGILICNLFKSKEPVFRFFPLPEDYLVNAPDDMPRSQPQELCTMGCANGVIKFVAVVGSFEYKNINDAVLKSWNLAADMRKWVAGTEVPIQRLWESVKLRLVIPTFPVISTIEDEVVYVILNDVDNWATCDEYARDLDSGVVLKAFHVLRVDMMRRKVLGSTKVVADHMTLRPNLLMSDFNIYLQGSKKHQGGLEASTSPGFSSSSSSSSEGASMTGSKKKKKIA